MAEAQSQRPLRKPVFVHVGDLKPDSYGLNIHLKVVEFKMVLERQRPDGSTLKIAEALVGDSTGSILMTVRGDQIDQFSVGGSILVRNAKIEMFKGHMRLAVDKWGLIQPAPTALEEEVNINNNLSKEEYERVLI
eukprot:TRINITY_DN2022_c0_g1_i5.p1 TRINITY_DN2022_c0_g1~~TRINITY_DN2022_c0_g1_i5.p1  ORF type:complete len:135 (+),score=24.67 TRINITY_DN2022_c0_g1_i5:137-541(+)